MGTASCPERDRIGRSGGPTCFSSASAGPRCTSSIGLLMPKSWSSPSACFKASTCLSDFAAAHDADHCTVDRALAFDLEPGHSASKDGSMRDPCQSKWSSGKWSQLWSRHQKLWSRPLKPGTRRFRAPVLSSMLGWSMADSNRRPLACQAGAERFWRVQRLILRLTGRTLYASRVRVVSGD